ncbi:MFS transporter [Streptomyces oceani]|uniref:MFS transporter n=1 Tax=Streptomyces oceani TaxID=1075402 RepID=A0A1E7KK10_9ACTN|nr:MFS transporter [Streptomyces oceani]OEV04206.1 MFS transporter [Streptomyces oceani]
MPRAVHILALGVFAMVTSEFVVAGLMPQMADGLNATIPQIGYLITAFGIAMAVGGPFLASVLTKLPPRTALSALFAVFTVGNVLAATATTYAVMLVARIVTGTVSAAFFGVALSLSVQLVREEVRARAIAATMNGLMLGTLLGLPLSTLIGGHFGWRAAFWAITALALLAALGTFVGVPNLAPTQDGGGVRGELAVFRGRRLWLALSTSALIIGATFAAFSYFNPILTEVTGFASGTVPLLLIAYGAATVVGNNIVGRLADRYALRVQLVGLALNTVFLAGFALLVEFKVAAVACLLGIGLVGISMNPAMVTRVQRAGNAGPLVNTVHASFITLGVVLGSWAGGLAINHTGLRAPLWLGAGLAVLGVGSLVPELLRARRATPRPGDPHLAEASDPGAAFDAAAEVPTGHERECARPGAEV